MLCIMIYQLWGIFVLTLLLNAEVSALITQTLCTPIPNAFSFPLKNDFSAITQTLSTELI